MSSKAAPLVSGMMYQAKKNCSDHHQPKKPNALPTLCSATTGKLQVTVVAAIQWTNVPKAWPLARTALGNTSEINTNMTAPCDMAKKAMKPISAPRTSPP